jgi:hypothetical protein
MIFLAIPCGSLCDTVKLLSSSESIPLYDDSRYLHMRHAQLLLKKLRKHFLAPLPIHDALNPGNTELSCLSFCSF